MCLTVSAIGGCGNPTGHDNNGEETWDVSAREYRISREVYYDKVLAGIVGVVSGVLSGFEFVGGNEPVLAMPDERFNLIEGPYGGGYLWGSAGVNRRLEPGKVASDDDYHIDFFNQLILSKNGLATTNKDIYNAWRHHVVNDWGGG